ncbi:MAG: phage tail protein [Synergistaceae bacterium]|nr:phage tail protein [Synergistaceae bacterium]
MIGSLGEIVFNVSENQILTFDGLNFQRKANYSEHSVHTRKGLLEFTGFSAATASMNIVLNEVLGINPREELERLNDIFVNHEAVPFILNGNPQGDGLWVIESMSVKYNFISSIGEPKIIEVSLNLKEYIEINENNSESSDFENDYYGIGNW